MQSERILLGYVVAVCLAPMSLAPKVTFFVLMNIANLYTIIFNIFFIAIAVIIPTTIFQFMLTVHFAEKLRIRFFLYYMFFGAVTGASSIAIILLIVGAPGSPNAEEWLRVCAAGSFCGLVYWLIAGRHAGST